MIGHHLAEFNFGTLRHDWDDPRVAGFVAGLDLVNGIAAQSKGFVWRLSDAEMESAQSSPEAVAAGDDRLASTLSVWEDAASLEHFVWNTVHRLFYERKGEWFDAVGSGNLVMWWVPAGHQPTFTEGMERWKHRETHGDSDHAFGWKYLSEAKLWKARACAPLAAE